MGMRREWAEAQSASRSKMSEVYPRRNRNGRAGTHPERGERHLKSSPSIQGRSRAWQGGKNKRISDSEPELERIGGTGGGTKEGDEHQNTGVTGHSGPTTRNLSAFSSPIPWRKASLRYNDNDMMTSALISSRRWTRSWTRTESSSRAAFSAGPILNCYAQSKALSVPPDGRFTLMEYRFDPSTIKPGAAPALIAAAAAQTQVQVPFTLRASLSITNHSAPNNPTEYYPGAFELTLTPRTDALEDVAIELYLGSGATGPKSNRRRRLWPVDARARTTHVALVPCLLRLYNLRHFPFRVGTATLRGGTDLVRAACGHAACALKIDQLKLSAETYKPYKGMRGWALGRVEWRVKWKGDK
ncbi:hypothetical protein V8E53_002180 [Lactarius tabidus]